MPHSNGRAAVVAGDEALAHSLGLLLRAVGLEVSVHARGRDFLAAPDAAFLFVDERLPDGRGSSLVARLREGGWDGMAVVMVGRKPPDTPPGPGVVHLEKPFVAEEILSLLAAAGAVPP